jgi:hypothetical protein
MLPGEFLFLKLEFVYNEKAPSITYRPGACIFFCILTTVFLLRRFQHAKLGRDTGRVQTPLLTNGIVARKLLIVKVFRQLLYK